MIGMLAFIAWVLMDNWPWNPGGKPHGAWVAWIAITFEVTILSASVGVAFLENTGAMETNIQAAETGWWFGRYDK